MNPLEILEKMHDDEKKILKALLELKQATSDEIAKKVGVSKNEVERASMWAKTKGALDFSEQVKEHVFLSPEGREYSEKDLPEKNLIKLVQNGVDRIDELKRKFSRTDIGIIWARNNDWIKITDGKILLTKNGLENLKKQNETEKILKELSHDKVDPKKIDQKILETLIKRGLLSKEIEKKKTYFLTDLGKQAAKRIPKILENEIGQLTPEILLSKGWKNKKIRKYDVTLPSPKIFPGKIQPYRQVIDEVKEKLVSLGFVEMRGPLVELNFWNCDALFMPSDHPARAIHDFFYVKNPKYGKILDREVWRRVEQTHKNGWETKSKGWGYWNEDLAKRLVLRSQGTAVSARTLHSLKKEDLPFKMFMIGRCFRPDVVDAQHSVDFDQCEGIVVGDGLNFINLLGYLKEIAKTVGAEKISFKPVYFPFTEGSVELKVYYKELGWVEAGGAGIFRPEVTMPLGINAPVLAWGLGIGRLAMMKLNIDDIRLLYSEDLGWMRSKEIVR